MLGLNYEHDLSRGVDDAYQLIRSSILLPTQPEAQHMKRVRGRCHLEAVIHEFESFKDGITQDGFGWLLHPEREVVTYKDFTAKMSVACNERAKRTAKESPGIVRGLFQKLLLILASIFVVFFVPTLIFSYM